ncbi:MAG: hypothetical protein FJY73_03930 [Candidatus Eisenbacteria bacterium]|nr:hypothetical protein [Candidatus Eisenbacteria bacterium]
MAEIKVTFVHPTDGRNATVTLDDTMTPEEAIAELITNDFIAPSTFGYCLGKKGGDRLANDVGLGHGGVKDGDKLTVIPNTDAGRH